MAVAVLLIAVAVPNIRSFILSNRLTTVAGDFVTAIHVARIEAIKSNVSSQFCSNQAASNTSDSLGTACGTHTGAVYVALVGGPTPVQEEISGLVAPVQLSGDVTAVRFGGDGLGHAIGVASPYNGPVAIICSSSLASNNRREIGMAAGSAVTVTVTSGACP